MKIDIIIPTMWRSKQLMECLPDYISNDSINKIIIIDNDHRRRPTNPIFSNSKIELVNYGKNIFVNPSWNEGYYRSTMPVIGIINDDIIVEGNVFRDIAHTDFTNIDLMGVHLKNTPDNYNIGVHEDGQDTLFKLNVNKDEAIGGQSYAFGVCMFIKRSSYSVIPSLYQIWFGDDYLVQKCQNIYCLKTSRISGEISKTLVALESNSEISDRIVLDCINASRHGHLRNSKNWDLIRQTVDRSKMRFSPSPGNIFAEQYALACNTPSDINQNVHILYELAKECQHVTEMGVRTGVSTRAFLNTDCELISYDIVLDKGVVELFQTARKKNKKVQYRREDVLNITIAETDLLFIDTLHTYEQLKQELKLHGDKSRKYIAFHDTYTYGLRGEVGNDSRGLLTAIIEFLIDNPQWKFKTHKTNNNGLTVLERTK